MKASTKVGKRIPDVKRIGQAFVLLCLLLLFGLVGVGINHVSQGAVPPAVPHGGLMAPTPPSGGGGDAGPSSIAAINGNIHIGG